METNNLGFFGTDPDTASDEAEAECTGSDCASTSSETEETTETEEEDTRFLTYYGEDRGAVISIEDTEFLSNSFCKGLIYYNRF